MGLANRLERPLICSRLFVLVALLATAEAHAQEIAPFEVRGLHTTRMTNGCLLINVRAAMRPRGSSPDWAATATAIYRDIARRSAFGDIIVDLRRDDIETRPRAENGLAYLGATGTAPGCPNASDKIDYFYVAGRLITEQELALRDIHGRLSDLDPDTADAKTQKLFKLPRNWMLPDTGNRKSGLVDPPSVTGTETTESRKRLSDLIDAKIREIARN